MKPPINQILKFERDIYELTAVKQEKCTEQRLIEINDAIRLKREAIKQLVPMLSQREAQTYALSKIDCTCGGHILLEAIKKLENGI